MVELTYTSWVLDPPFSVPFSAKLVMLEPFLATVTTPVFWLLIVTVSPADGLDGSVIVKADALLVMICAPAAIVVLVVTTVKDLAALALS